MYSYVLKLVLKDGSEVELWTKSTNGMLSVIDVIEESYTELEDVDGVLYFKKEWISEDHVYTLDDLLELL